MNIFILALVYAGNDNLRSHLPRSLQTLVGAKEPSHSSKYQLNLDWIDKTPNLKRFVNKLSNEELAKPDRAEVIRVSLFEALIDLAVAENERGKEFPNLLKMSSVRRAISILKKLNADLNLLQMKMEAAYGLCKGLKIRLSHFSMKIRLKIYSTNYSTYLLLICLTRHLIIFKGACKKNMEKRKSASRK